MNLQGWTPNKLIHAGEVLSNAGYFTFSTVEPSVKVTLLLQLCPYIFFYCKKTLLIWSIR